MFQFRRFPAYCYFIHSTLTRYCRAGFPHSDICGSRDICSSPQLFAAYHVFRRLLVPRHPPCALLRLTTTCIALHVSAWVLLLSCLLLIVSFWKQPLGCLVINHLSSLASGTRKTSFPRSWIFAEYPLPSFRLHPLTRKRVRAATANPAGCSTHD